MGFAHCWDGLSTEMFADDLNRCTIWFFDLLEEFGNVVKTSRKKSLWLQMELQEFLAKLNTINLGNNSDETLLWWTLLLCFYFSN